MAFQLRAEWVETAWRRRRSSASVHLEGDEDGEDVVDEETVASLNNEIGGVTGLATAVFAPAPIIEGCGDGVAIRAKRRSFLDLLGGDDAHFVSEVAGLLTAADAWLTSDALPVDDEARSINSDDELEAEMDGTMGGE